MTELKTTAARMVAEARARIEEIDTADLIARADDPDLVIVDIRDIRERKQGFIPGSVHAPRGMLEFWIDPESPYAKEKFQSGDKFVFYCASGWRSALSAQVAQEMGLENVSHISDGFGGWKKSGGCLLYTSPSPRDRG